MKEARVFALIVVLSTAFGIIIESARGLLEQNSSKGSFLNTSDPIWAMAYGILFGGAFGVLLGIVAGTVFGLVVNTVGNGKIPLTYILTFSLFIGILELGFYFNLISKTLPSYTAVFRSEWAHLIVGFIGGSLKAFIPLIIVKKYFDL